MSARMRSYILLCMFFIEFKTLMEQDQILGFNGIANGLQNVNSASKSASGSGSNASAETDNDENKQTDDSTKKRRRKRKGKTKDY